MLAGSQHTQIPSPKVDDNLLGLASGQDKNIFILISLLILLILSKILFFSWVAGKARFRTTSRTLKTETAVYSCLSNSPAWAFFKTSSQ